LNWVTSGLRTGAPHWPVEETFNTGKDVLGFDQSQARSHTGLHRHTVLTALATLRQVAALTLHTTCAPATDPPPAPPARPEPDPEPADLPVPTNPASPTWATSNSPSANTADYTP
jgi:hypothetical protein